MSRGINVKYKIQISLREKWVDKTPERLIRELCEIQSFSKFQQGTVFVQLLYSGIHDNIHYTHHTSGLDQINLVCPNKIFRTYFLQITFVRTADNFYSKRGFLYKIGWFRSAEKT